MRGVPQQPSRPVQRGFSLVELMVALTLSAIIMVSVTASYTSTMAANASSLAQARLTQDTRAVMDVMTRELRRTGYWGSAATAAAQNPYSPSEYGSGTGANATCILYAYDADDSGNAAVPNGEKFGFRLRNGAIQWARGGANNCNGNWGANTNITDPNTTTVTALDIDVWQPECTNLSDTPSSNCNPCAAGYTPWANNDRLLRVWRVDIGITAQANNITGPNGNVPNVQINDTVRMRNEDLVLQATGAGPAAGTGPCAP